jgi:hypothetical protein
MRFIFPLLLLAFSLTAQTTATFEQTNFGGSNYLDNAGTTGAFAAGNIALVNNYNSMFMSWEGWALSKVTDNTTAGFTNQFSCIAGKGALNSTTYAVGYVFAPAVVRLTGAAAGKGVQGLYLNNNTYSYLSMKDGDSFAKKFGGPSGNDPDFFLLTIKAMKNGQTSADSVNFYLADYRFADNTQDYLVKDWTFVNLSSLSNADSLLFSLASSDLGAFGINTPTYFCMDNLTTLDGSVAQFEPAEQPALSVYPNPASEVLYLENAAEKSIIQVIDQQGKVVMSVNQGTKNVQIGHLASGWYAVRAGAQVTKFYKL